MGGGHRGGHAHGRAGAPGSTYDEVNPIIGPWKARTHWKVVEFTAPQRPVHVSSEAESIKTWTTVTEPATPNRSWRNWTANGEMLETVDVGWTVMWIRRVMPNVVASDLEASRRFYTEFLGLETSMDEPGFLMLSSATNPTAELTVCSEDQREWDPDTARTQMGIEVEDVDAVHADAERRGLKIVRPLSDEPWGIRRFFVEDPDGTVINVHSHIGESG